MSKKGKIYFGERTDQVVDILSVPQYERAASEGKKGGHLVLRQDRKGRKKVEAFVRRIQTSDKKLIASEKLSIPDKPALLLFLRSLTSTCCSSLLMKFDHWYYYLSAEKFARDHYFSETEMTIQDTYKCQFYNSTFNIQEKPCLVFSDQKVQPVNYIAIESVGLEILMRGSFQLRLFAVLDFLEAFWSTGMSPFQMSEDTIRKMLVWVSVGRASKKMPIGLRKKNRTLWDSIRVNRILFREQESRDKGGSSAK